MNAALNTKYKFLSSAFTLIELLVVISIIGILTVLVAANLNSARSRARDAQRKSDIKNVSTALRLYYNDNGEFPSGDLDWGESWTSADQSTVYMAEVPQDPLNASDDSKTYYYERGDTYGGEKDTFKLTACLENPSDSQGKGSEAAYSCSSGRMFQIAQE